MCFYLPSKARVLPSLKLNDQLPNILIENNLSGKIERTNVQSLYQNGMLLISFWATWCKPCIDEMELLAQLAAKHKNKLKILSVTYQDKKTIQAYLKQNPIAANSAIEFITDDKVFTKLFFHQTLPHNIWIDRTGKIKAITGGEEITDQAVTKFMASAEQNMFYKKEVKFDQFKPLHIPDSLIEYRAIFNKKVEGLNMSGTVISPANLGRPNMTRFFAFNTLIKNLFWCAYLMPGYQANTYLMEINTSDSSKFFWPGDGLDTNKYTGLTRKEWGRANRYTYELRTPIKLTDSAFSKKVIADLELNLNLHTERKLKLRNCYVVTANNPALITGKVSDKFYLGIKGDQLVISGIPMDYLLNWLVIIGYKIKGERVEPYLNRTGINQPITAIINLGNANDKSSRENIEKCLTAQLGITFTLKEALYPILVINDKN